MRLVDFAWPKTLSSYDISSRFATNVYSFLGTNWPLQLSDYSEHYSVFVAREKLFVLVVRLLYELLIELYTEPNRIEINILVFGPLESEARRSRCLIKATLSANLCIRGQVVIWSIAGRS
jgi:hypothetical protein